MHKERFPNICGSEVSGSERGKQSIPHTGRRRFRTTQSSHVPLPSKPHTISQTDFLKPSGWPVEPVEVWPNSHTTAYHLGPPLVADLDLQRKQGLWSLCSPHPITTPSLPQGLSSGEHIHKPIATNSPKWQALAESGRLLVIVSFLSPHSQA